ncbi:exonuclease subunit SbcD [Vibrio sp. 99-70-13A1]|uniref:exonuclease subunit SbcD n=1 Tax=Vibrio sp. 99-70-13A1 TaxID=2607601 RepID=UPI001493747D|nr:exonuclease subunit SbcD [Vibrio sp. 99-70-13A1]NOH95802.1 exonuclease subunit SbcD [Vibrio sp. 99-70-13A1]
MRILHTSDWHFGQNFFTKSRKNEHQLFIQWLLKQVTAFDINAVIVAGDVFDTGAPPSYAREMYNQFVVDLNQLGCQLVVLGGNHDSVSTLNESKQLLACLNTHVIANTSDDLDSQIIPLMNKDKVGAYLCAVPFVRARDVVSSQAGESGADKQQALGQAISQHYHSLYDHANEMRQSNQLSIPIVATGHLTALGVTTSESVRDIYIGTLDGFDAKGFPPADYIALGHIHRPQIVAKKQHIRYSGSPIPLSFDELKSEKQVVMVEFEADKVSVIETISVPRFQAMESVKGDLQEVESKLKELATDYSEENVWVSVEVKVQDYLSDLQNRIQDMVEGTNIEVLQLRRARENYSASLSQQNNETLAELTPFDVFSKRLELEVFEGEDQQNRKERITQTFKQIVSDIEHKDSAE